MVGLSPAMLPLVEECIAPLIIRKWALESGDCLIIGKFDAPPHGHGTTFLG